MPVIRQLAQGQLAMVEILSNPIRRSLGSQAPHWITFEPGLGQTRVGRSGTPTASACELLRRGDAFI
jgi:hypothetical protein